MLYCRKLCPTAREPIPVRDRPGCFQLYLAFPLQIDPKQVVRVDPGISFKVSSTAHHYPIIVSDQTAVARGLIVYDYNSAVNVKDNDATKVEFNMYNSSDVVITLDVGYPVARLLMTQTASLAVKCVESFPSTELDLVKEESIADKIMSYPKTEIVWFKRMMKDNFNECFKLFFTTLEGEVFHKQIEAMRETDEYKKAGDKAKYESDWAWKCLPTTIREEVCTQFKEYRKKLLNGTK